MNDYGAMVRQLMMHAQPVGDVVPFRQTMPEQAGEIVAPYRGGRGGEVLPLPQRAPRLPEAQKYKDALFEQQIARRNAEWMKAVKSGDRATLDRLMNDVMSRLSE